MSYISLKAKMAVGASLLFLLLSGGTHYGVVTYFQRHLAAAMAKQQFSFIAQVAGQLDQDIEEARHALLSEAKLVSYEMLADPEEAQKFLDQRKSLQTVFNYGLFLFSDTGKLIAESNFRPHRRGMDFSNLAYIRVTMATKQPYVSAPYLSATENYHPVVMFAAPVIDRQGRLLGVFTGGMDLVPDKGGNSSILSKPALTSIGKSGHIAMYTTDGIVISHTYTDRILASFKNRTLEEAKAGQPGTRETVDWRGVPVLMSAMPLKTTGWILSSSYPTNELYAPIDDARRLSLNIMLVGTAVAVVLSWMLASFLTNSLSKLTSQVIEIGRAPGYAPHVSVDSSDETIHLASAINAMLDAIEKSRQELRSLASELALAEESERRRIASDLHDSIAQSLAFANLELGQLRSLVPNQVAARLDSLRKVIGESVDGIRSLIFDLSPPILYELGFSQAVEWLADRNQEQFGLDVEVVEIGEMAELQADIKVTLFRAIRELLVNVAKHSGTKQARVEIGYQKNSVRIAVSDHGKGFNPSELAEKRQRAGGFGIFSMQERLRSLGALVKIESAPGKGVCALIEAPLSPIPNTPVKQQP